MSDKNVYAADIEGILRLMRKCFCVVRTRATISYSQFVTYLPMPEQTYRSSLRNKPTIFDIKVLQLFHYILQYMLHIQRYSCSVNYYSLLHVSQRNIK